MSFKTKRWALLKQVNMADHVPGIKAYQTPGGAGINTGGWAVPFRGKIVVMAYAADDTPLYAFYDPVTDTVSGTTTLPGAGVWYGHSPTHGNSSCFVVWGNTHLLVCPLSIGYYYSRPRFCGFDAGLAFHDPPFNCGSRDHGYMGSGLGVSGGEPCFVSYQWRGNPYYDSYGLIKHTLAGTSVARAGNFWFDAIWGSTYFGQRLLEGYWVWYNDGLKLYSSPPEAEDDPYLAAGSFGGSWTGENAAARQFTPHPAGGQTWMWTLPDGEDGFWALASAPLAAAGERPWGGYIWDYRHMRDGGYAIDDHDLDGIEHGVSFASGPGSGPITKLSNGWYAGVTSTGSNTNPAVYVLDPGQPGQFSRTRRAFSQTACFMGDYAIGDDLKLAHVLPLPGRDPSGVSLPPQDRKDGYIIGFKELFRRSGNGISYVRDMKLKFEGYSFGEDWWWPGESPDHTLDTTLDFFAGAPTIMGRYPDYMWGRLNPLGGDVSRGLGMPEEHLDAQGDDPIYVVRENQVIAGTRSWVTPGATGYAILRGSLSDQRLCYHEVYANLGSAPQWNARGGLLVGDEWHTLVNFEEIDMPPLGQDGWTVFGLCPIPRCRSLPRGGWLVCAELYFAPWETWEWDPGPRNLTFRNTGLGHVPAKWGYIGPLEVEDWHPRYLTGYDEWTRGRSDYGPAALIVFDYDGGFVECLNDLSMYPPYAGSEIAILPGSVPRLMYRVKGGGTYSDCAEGWGCYQNNSGEPDFQSPLFAVYDLENNARLQPGAGRFCGFVDMHDMENYETKAAGWRWSALAAAYDWEYPKSIWSPYNRVKVREGVGGRGLTLLTPRGISTKTGVRGVASRSER